jgi:ferredoxin like protein
MKKDSSLIESKLSTLKYYADKDAHLKVNQEICAKCEDKCCTFVCPANVYEYDEENGIMKVEHENCLECGACRYACEKNAIEWQYPKASCGVLYKFS